MKTNLFFLFLLCASLSFAQAKPSAFLETGYLLESAINPSPTAGDATDRSPAYYAALSSRFPLFTYFFIEGSISVLLIQTEATAFLPLSGFPINDTYSCGFGAVFGPLTLGLKHSCSHPVTPNGATLLFGDAAYTALYARLDLEF